VEFIAERGAIPVVKMPDTGKARSTAGEWKAALAGFQAAFDGSRYAGIWLAKNRGEWIADFGAYLHARDALRLRHEAEGAKSHKARLALLAAGVKMLTEGNS
jgi:hypothetical protein